MVNQGPAVWYFLGTFSCGVDGDSEYISGRIPEKEQAGGADRQDRGGGKIKADNRSPPLAAAGQCRERRPRWILHRSSGSGRRLTGAIASQHRLGLLPHSARARRVLDAGVFRRAMQKLKALPIVRLSSKKLKPGRCEPTEIQRVRCLGFLQ
jgi:hypothetical protein